MAGFYASLIKSLLEQVDFNIPTVETTEEIKEETKEKEYAPITSLEIK